MPATLRAQLRSHPKLGIWLAFLNVAVAARPSCRGLLLVSFRFQFFSWSALQFHSHRLSFLRYRLRFALLTTFQMSGRVAY